MRNYVSSPSTYILFNKYLVNENKVDQTDKNIQRWLLIILELLWLISL